MTKETLKQAARSILIGACVAFITSFIDGFAEFLKNHATEILNGGVASAAYLAMIIKRG